MKVLAAIVVATVLLVPLVPAEAASEDVIRIGTADELMEIGITLPTDGDYVLTGDIVMRPPQWFTVSFTDDGSELSMSVTADGYGPSDEVDSLLVAINGSSATSDTLPEVSFPSSVLCDQNVLAVELDSVLSMAVLSSEEIRSGEGVAIPAGNGFQRISPTFTGTLDGCGHRISGIVMNGEGSALFSSSLGATFRNMTIEGTFGTLIAEDLESRGSLTSDTHAYSSALVSKAKDTTFERVRTESTVISCILSDMTVLQGGEDGCSFSVGCSRTCMSGALVADSEGCDYVSCVSSGTVASCTGSVLTFDAKVTPTDIGTSSDEEHNVSLTMSGGIVGDSREDRFAFCASSVMMVNTNNDRVVSSIDLDQSDENRCQVTSMNGSVSGRMYGTIVHACTDTTMDEMTSVMDLDISGTYSYEALSGAICGSSENCEMSRCNIMQPSVSGRSTNDSVTDVSEDTVIPDCTFSLRIDTDDAIRIEGDFDPMDGMGTVLEYVGNVSNPGIECVGGTAHMSNGRLVLNPDFDWSTMTYNDMDVEVRGPDGPVSADLIILGITCAIGVALFLIGIRSLRL